MCVCVCVCMCVYVCVLRNNNTQPDVGVPVCLCAVCVPPRAAYSVVEVLKQFTGSDKFPIVLDSYTLPNKPRSYSSFSEVRGVCNACGSDGVLCVHSLTGMACTFQPTHHPFPPHGHTHAQAADEMGLARVWAGVHYQTAIDVAVSQGQSVGGQALKVYAWPGSNKAPPRGLLRARV
jgi:hypothetical protein